MSSIARYRGEFVESFPTPFEPGVLYVSPDYSTAGHLCPCGCGGQVVTKLSPARWSLIFDGEVSLRPSVAAIGLPCNSHYFITRGAVQWSPRLTSYRASVAIESDRQAIDRASQPEAPFHWLRRQWRRLRRKR